MAEADIWGQGLSAGKTSTPCLVVHFAIAYYVKTNMKMSFKILVLRLKFYSNKHETYMVILVTAIMIM